MDSRRRGRGWRLAVPLVAVVAGTMFATSAVTARGTDLRSEAGDLPSVIRDEQRRADVQAAQVEALRAQVAAATDRQAASNNSLSELAARAGQLESAAGLTSVIGPALRVTLTDAPKPATGQPLPDGLTYDDYVVHQQDLQAVVNALWLGGTEAMTLMDQRVISTSAVRCVGNTLLLQGRVYSPPYTVVAIGDPDRLREALDADPSVSVYREYVAAIGLGYAVRRLDSAEVGAFTGPLTLQHARPAR